MTKWIRLTRGLEAQVDDGDYAALARYHWRVVIGRDGLPHAVRVPRRTPPFSGSSRDSARQMQRVILDPHNIRPSRAKVQYRNGDTLDNRRENLCWTSTVENHAERQLPKTNRTGLLGVHLAASGLYRVQLQVARRRFSGGTHLEAAEAARAYNALALRHIGAHAALNAVPDPIFNQSIYEGTIRKRRSPRPKTPGPVQANVTSNQATEVSCIPPSGSKASAEIVYG